ncbi:hypothetical protein MYCOZU1_01132 [Mycobacterium intracellulare subsp. chimaera]|uniref:Uncharacterized protein n=1 Tax=Mycobacterium intracellulare subsp. chimaera TaxID=222805 RepID=A0A220Y704_MYCIT|nr:hypothetical protein MYCODSM44623_01038 [Mycobacterium intracellulare subsp. chimaera]ASL13450.1 hypothetical protein MYCOZU2_01008 [Mycobacterium intracellulare subsp. chimaera]ASL19583.1 hypothetical protein MYCOZU1_01132 [Mycobacterium intracellulare subsp. chimaera]
MVEDGDRKTSCVAWWTARHASITNFATGRAHQHFMLGIMGGRFRRQACSAADRHTRRRAVARPRCARLGRPVPITKQTSSPEASGCVIRLPRMSTSVAARLAATPVKCRFPLRCLPQNPGNPGRVKPPPAPVEAPLPAPPGPVKPPDVPVPKPPPLSLKAPDPPVDALPPPIGVDTPPDPPPPTVIPGSGSSAQAAPALAIGMSPAAKAAPAAMPSLIVIPRRRVLQVMFPSEFMDH